MKKTELLKEVVLIMRMSFSELQNYRKELMSSNIDSKFKRHLNDAVRLRANELN